jgi:integrase
LKYDILENLRDYLQSQESENTAKTYYAFAKKVLKNNQFSTIEGINKDALKEAIRALPTKSRVSAAKQSMKYLKKLYPSFDMPEEEFFKETMGAKTNRRRTRKEAMQYSTVMRKINALKDKKLKLAYRLAVVSGLRVSELGDLEKRDIEFRNCSSGHPAVFVHVRNGKGGKSGIVQARKDDYLYRELNKWVPGMTNDNDRLFYSAGHMKNMASGHGFECHDLRRAFAQLVYWETKQNGGSVDEARAEVQKGLRHEKFSTSKRYLSRNISFKRVKRAEGR